ncbi:MAG TPA: histone deacetylase family protein [Oscillatoriaceae cyanobacterium]
MKVVHSLAHVVHNPRWEFTRGRRIYSKDIPSRATLIREALEASGMPIELTPPREQPTTLIAETHAYFEFLRDTAATLAPDAIIYPDVFPIRRAARRPESHAALAGYYCFDTGTPLTRNVYLAAKGAVDIALTAAELLPQEGLVYALCRPPGHHAEREVFGGYCYFNNPAIAAKHLALAGRVAVLDIDYHHGNGTQDVFYDRGDVLTVSIHGDPEQVYPYFSGFADERGAGAGEGANLNLPLPPSASRSLFLNALDEALAAIRRFAPTALVLAVGFDTCKGDPAGSFALDTRDYPAIAARIAELGMPTLIVQEGGYNTEKLGRNAVAFLQAYEKGARR